MKIETTHHASIRMSQRGISAEALELISMFGIEYEQKGNSAVEFIDKKGIKRLKSLRKEIDRLLRSNQVIRVNSTRNDHLITTFFKSSNKKVRHNG